MADKIKKFFAKKKSDAKFKQAGPGHKLSEGAGAGGSEGGSGAGAGGRRPEQSAEARRAAADAALARLQGNKRDTNFNTSLAAVQAQVRRELEAERRAEREREANNESRDSTRRGEIQELEASPALACRGVYFRCPLISSGEVLSREEWKPRIRTFLYEQLEHEPGLTACLIIHSCNSPREKVKECADTLCKYLENITREPTEIKYQRIRLSNRVLRERVLSCEGGEELLRAAGFSREGEGDDEHFVWGGQIDEIEVLVDALRTCSPVQLELDRGTCVLLPRDAERRTDLPAAFYSLTGDELRREQRTREDEAERLTQLRTRAMREREEQRELRRYRYVLVRVRVPEGVLLQGVFTANEPAQAVYEWMRECLAAPDLPFSLGDAGAGGARLDPESERSLAELRLAPAALLIFSWHRDYAQAIADTRQPTLSPHLMALLQDDTV